MTTITTTINPTSARSKRNGLSRKRGRLVLHANPPRPPMVFAGVVIGR